MLVGRGGGRRGAGRYAGPAGRHPRGQLRLRAGGIFPRRPGAGGGCSPAQRRCRPGLVLTGGGDTRQERSQHGSLRGRVPNHCPPLPLAGRTLQPPGDGHQVQAAVRKWPSVLTATPVVLVLASEHRNTITRAASSAVLTRRVAAAALARSSISAGTGLSAGVKPGITTLVRMPSAASSRDIARLRPWSRAL